MAAGRNGWFLRENSYRKWMMTGGSPMSGHHRIGPCWYCQAYAAKSNQSPAFLEGSKITLDLLGGRANSTHLSPKSPERNLASQMDEFLCMCLFCLKLYEID